MTAGSEEVVDALRALMKTQGLAALVVPSEDAHGSEYVPLCDRRREFVSGFTGSAGTVVVTLDQALLWTDGRYFLQAEKELGPGWVLMRSLEKDVPTVPKWLADNLDKGAVVGINGLLISSGQAKTWSKELEPKGVVLNPLDKDLVDAVWKEQPPQPSAPVLPHALEYAGQTIEDKLKDVRAKVKSKGASSLLVTALDEIAWLYNIRGGDVEYNPVTIAYSVVREEEAILFIDQAKLTPEAAKHLSDAHVALLGYEEVRAYLSSSLPPTEAVLVDPNLVSVALVSLLNPASVVEGPSPITMAKACKNPAELEGMRQAHVRDGAALVAFLAWLERTLKEEGGAPASSRSSVLTEAGVATKLEEFRRAQPKFVSLSFASISAVGANGAIIHYKPPDDHTSAAVTADQMFLLDSGAQYLDGTTDVTRTVHFGKPTEEEKRAFTLVLRGHIALAQARFPEGTMGHKLDILARLPLWGVGLDYKHGTGHGVGAFLNVHEGPQSISYKKRAYEEGLYPGMVTSNEPGFYEDGKFGIRIESIVICNEAHTPHQFGGLKYCEFETITMAPIQAKLMDLSLLTPSDRHWIDEYHATVRATLAPLLADDPLATDYLLRETAPLPPGPA